jgi:hypothetical protein
VVLVTREGFSSGSASRGDAKLIFVNQSSSLARHSPFDAGDQSVHTAVNTRPNMAAASNSSLTSVPSADRADLACRDQMAFVSALLLDGKHLGPGPRLDSSKRGYVVTLTKARGLDGVRALMGVLRRSTGGSDFAHERHHNDREREAGANSKVGIGKCQHQRLTIGQQP